MGHRNRQPPPSPPPPPSPLPPSPQQQQLAHRREQPALPLPLLVAAFVALLALPNVALCALAGGDGLGGVDATALGHAPLLASWFATAAEPPAPAPSRDGTTSMAAKRFAKEVEKAAQETLRLASEMSARAATAAASSGVPDRLRRQRQSIATAACAGAQEGGVDPIGGFCESNSMNCCVNPGLADVLLELYGNDSVVDVGAGQGTYELYALASSSSSSWSSFDGTNGIEQQTNGRVRFRDAVAAVDLQGLLPSDWAQCIETAEHVPHEQQAALVANLHYLNKKGVVISWALPGQPGHQHVNPRSNQYVQSLFEALGYQREWRAEARGRAAIAATLNATALRCSHRELPRSVCGARASQRYEFWVRRNSSFEATLRKRRQAAYSSCIAEGDETRYYFGTAGGRGCRTLPSCMQSCPWLYDTIMIFTRAASGGDEAAAVPTWQSVTSRLRDGFAEEQRRLDALLARVRSSSNGTAIQTTPAAQ